MMWSEEQARRLAVEEKLLAKYLPDLQFHDRSGNTYIEGPVRTSGGTNEYRLRLELPKKFPRRMPRLYVTSPKVLWMRGHRKPLSAIGHSHAFHLIANGREGPVQICYIGRWNPSMTCVKALLAGILWLEAYESYLRTGRKPAKFLR